MQVEGGHSSHTSSSSHFATTRQHTGRLSSSSSNYANGSGGAGAAWVEAVKWQKRGRGELVSGARDGRVVVWDVRKGSPSAVIYPQQQGSGHGSAASNVPRGLGGVVIHDEANVVVTSVHRPLSC